MRSFCQLFFAFICIVSVEKAIDQLPNDILTSIGMHLSNTERDQSFRAISSRFNKLVDQRHHQHIAEFRILLSYLLSPDVVDWNVTSCIDHIGNIHHFYSLNEQWSAVWPSIMRQFVRKIDGDVDQMFDIITNLRLEMDLESIFLDSSVDIEAFVGLDDITRTLIESSRMIAVYLVMGEVNEIEANCLKLMYLHCFEYLSDHSNGSFPSYDNVFYLEEHKEHNQAIAKQYELLANFRDAYGLIIIHRKYLEWSSDKHVDMDLYVDTLMVMVQDYIISQHHSIDTDTLYRFFVRWIVKILNVVDFVHFHQFVHSHSHSCERFIAEIVTPSLEYLSRHGLMSHFECILKGLQRLDALELLHNVNFLEYLVIHHLPENPIQFTNFLEMILCHLLTDQDDGSTDISDISNRHRAIVLAQSIYLWITGNTTESINVMRGFQGHSVDMLQRVFKFNIIPGPPLEQQTYFVQIMHVLNNDDEH